MKNEKKPLIFILEDDKHLHEVIKNALLMTEAMTIEAFESPEDMIGAPNLTEVDLFIIDINLKSAISGFEVPNILPEHCRFAGYLFMSGYPVNNELYEKAAGLSLFDFIAKPFTLNLLRQRVKALLFARLQLPNNFHDYLLHAWSNNPFLAFVADADLIIRLANKRLAHLLEVDKPADMIGQSLQGYISTQFFDNTLKTFAGIIADDESIPCEIETEVLSKSGQAHRILWFCSPFEGEVKGLILAVGVPCANRLSRRFSNIYREMLLKDRATIRNIEPLKIPGTTACQWEV